MKDDPKDRLLHVITQSAVAFLCASLIARPLTSGETIGQDLRLLLQFFPLFAALLWLSRMVLNRELQYVRTALEVPLAVLVGAMLISLFRASCLFPALSTGFDWLIDLLLFLLVVQVAQDPSVRRSFERVFLATALVVAVYGIIQRVKGFPEMWVWIDRNPLEAKRMLGIWDPVNWNDLKSRLGTNEVFSTFLIPNALAGYFLMVVPVLGVSLWLSRFQGKLGKLAFGMKALAAVAVLSCLLLTGAKGAWACLPVQAAVFVLLLGDQLPERRRRTAILGLAGAVSLGALLLALVPRLRGYGLALWDSLHVRFGYWDTARVMLCDGANWLFGVGLANFQEAYPYYKTVTASEVQKAHNHYLQLWTEIGILGLAGFVAAWVICGVRSLRSPLATREEAAPERRTGEQVSLILGGLLGFVTISNFARPFKSVPSSNDDVLIGAGLFLLWAVYVLADGARARVESVPAEREAVLRRAGYLTGLAGMLLHSVIDFDLSVAGCSQSLWLLGGLALSMVVVRKVWRRRLGDVGQALSMLAALAVFAGLTLGVLPRVTESDVRGSRGREALGLALLERNAGKRAAQLEQAVEDFAAAAEQNPIDPDLQFDLGTAYQHLWMTTGQSDAVGKGYAAMKRAIDLAPFRAGYHYRLGQFLEMLGALEAPPSALETHILPGYESPGLTPEVPKRWRPALAEYQRVAELYPTKPEAQLAEADLLWKLKLRDHALARYRALLELDDRIDPRWRNLRLGKEIRTKIEERVSGPADKAGTGS